MSRNNEILLNDILTTKLFNNPFDSDFTFNLRKRSNFKDILQLLNIYFVFE